MNDNQSEPSWKIGRRGAMLLLFNHFDAWVVALVLCTVALVVHGRLDGRHAWLMAAVALGYWLAFALNDYYDAPADALDPHKQWRNFFVRHPLTGGQCGAAVAILSLPIILMLGSFGWRGWLVLPVCFLIMWGYSAPPLHFKNRPGVDLLIHALFVQTFPYAIGVFVPGGGWGRVDAAVLSIAFLSSLTAQLEQQVRDYVGDSTAGLHTFATRYGQTLAARLLWWGTLFLLAGSAVALLTAVLPSFLAPIWFLALPGLGHRLIRPAHAPRSEKLVYFSILLALGYFVWLVGGN